MSIFKIVSRYDSGKVLFEGEFWSLRECVVAAVSAGIVPAKSRLRSLVGMILLSPGYAVIWLIERYL